jgi:hypothetical protein
MRLQMAETRPLLSAADQNLKTILGAGIAIGFVGQQSAQSGVARYVASLHEPLEQVLAN